MYRTWIAAMEKKTNKNRRTNMMATRARNLSEKGPSAHGGGYGAFKVAGRASTEVLSPETGVIGQMYRGKTVLELEPSRQLPAL